MEDFFKGIELSMTLYEEMRDLSYVTFFSLLALLIDSYCADHEGYDPVEEANALARMVKEVNEEVGPM